MKRKVVQHGPSTLIVSLPSKWVQKYGVKKGDELDCEENGNSIVVRTDKAVDIGKIDLDLSGLDRTSILYSIRSMYKLGYNNINSYFKKPTAFHYRIKEERPILFIIHEELSRLTGIEIIQQRENSCQLKTLVEMSPKEFNVILRRIFFLLIDMNEDFITGTKKKDETLLKTLYQKHNTITKFVSFCMRLLNKIGYAENQKKTTIVYTILTDLDNLVEVIKNTGRMVRALKPDISEDVLKLINSVHEAIVKYYNLFYNFDNNTVAKINKLRDDYIEQIDFHPEKFSKEELALLNRYFQIMEILTSLLELTIALNFSGRNLK